MEKQPSGVLERQWISPEECAQQASLCTATIRRMIADGELRAYRAGRRVRVNATDFNAFMRSRPVCTAAAS
jgi:excisionase family DNA binding protein